MRRLVLAAATLCAVAGAALSSAADRSPAPPPGSRSTIAAAPGRAAAVSRELARLGAPVTRARRLAAAGARARPGCAARLRRVPGRARRRPGRGAVARPGHLAGRGAHRRRRAAVARPHGAGIRIAVVDLGFGDTWRSLLGKELPPLTQIDAIQSFDHTSGKPEINGLSNDDQPTGHGANVAQVVWDIAPGARYTLVNYHTQLELSQAVDWLVNGPDGKPRVDIVVHSQLVPRRAVRRHRRGRARPSIARTTRASSGSTRPATTPAATGRAWSATRTRTAGPTSGPAARGYLAFPLAAGIGMGATLYWSSCTQGRRRRARRRARASSSTSPTPPPSSPVVFAQGQKDAAQPASVVGYLPPTAGTYGLRVLQGDAGRRLRRSRSSAAGVELGDEATPGVEHPDARRRARLVHGRRARLAGRRRGRLLLAGPDRGRAPQARCRRARLDRRLARHRHGRHVGLGAARGRRGGAAHAARPRRGPARAIPTRSRGELIASALDIAPPGPDAVTGAGRIRLDVDPPAWISTTPAAGPAGRATRRASTSRVDDAGTIEASGVSIDGVAAAEVAGRPAPAPRHARARAGPAHARSSGRATWPATAPSWRCRSCATAPPPVAALAADGGGARGRR